MTLDGWRCWPSGHEWGRVRGVARMMRGDGALIEVEMSARVFRDRRGQDRRVAYGRAGRPTKDASRQPRFRGRDLDGVQSCVGRVLRREHAADETVCRGETRQTVAARHVAPRGEHNGVRAVLISLRDELRRGTDLVASSRRNQVDPSHAPDA